MKIYILVVNRKEQYLVDSENAKIVGEQAAEGLDLNFTRRKSPKEINVLSVMLVKKGYLTHLEIVEGKDYDEGSPQAGIQ